MWVLVVIVFVSMTLSDTFKGIYTLLLAAQINSVVFRLFRWECRKHDLAFLFDGLSDIGGAFAAVGSGLSLLQVTNLPHNTIEVHVIFTFWTVLTIIGMMAGSQIGGLLGDALSLRIAGRKVRKELTPLSEPR